MLHARALRPLVFSLLCAAACGCGGSGDGGGGGGVTGPEIEVFTPNALVTTGGAFALGVIGLDEFVAVPVAIRNTGGTVLNITGAIGITPTACACTLRDAPPASVAAGDTGIFTLLFKGGTSGSPSAAISIPSDDTDENPFAFTLTFVLASATHCTYTADVGGVKNLYASAFPGAPGTTQVNSAVGAGATGVQQNFHLVNRTLYTCQFVAGQDTDICLRGLGAALPAAQANLTSALTTPAGFFGQIRFAAGDNVVFTYNTGAPSAPTKLFSMTIAGAVAGTPLELSGSLPVGSPSGVQGVFVSPRKDQVAFLGDFDTAGVAEVFLVPFAGGARIKLSAPLIAGTSIDPGSIVWLRDQSGLLYETRVTVSNQQRVLHHVRLGGAVTPLNGPVTAGRTGVIPDRTRASASATHVFFLTDEASGTGKRELKFVSLVGGALSAAVTLNGVAVPGTAGAGAFGSSFDGTKALFIADSGSNQEPELWQSLIAGAAATTTKIVPRPAANRAVVFDGDRGILSSSVAWCTQNDAVVGRQELFFIDWSTAVPTLTRVINNSTFPGGTGIVDLSQVHPQPDFHVAINSNQGNANGSVFGASLSSTPNAVRLQARTTAGSPTVRGLRVAYEADNGAVPQDAFCNLITGGAEIQMGTSSSVTGALVLFSEARGFWHTFTPNLFNASTTAAGTQQDTDAIGGSDIGSVKLGFEPRP